MTLNISTTPIGDGWWYQQNSPKFSIWPNDSTTGGNSWIDPWKWPKPCVPYTPYPNPCPPVVVRPNIIIKPPKTEKPKAKVKRRRKKSGKRGAKTKQTFVALILDKSGSMGSCYNAALDAINEQIETIKKNAKKGGQTYVTLILFNHEIEIVYENVLAEDIDKLTEEDYIVGGMTALRDAMSVAIDSLYEHEEDGRNQGFLTVLVSDGMENSSGTTKAELKGKIDECDSDKWTFTYMLGGHSWENIQDFVLSTGASYGNTVSYTADNAGTQMASKGLSSSMSNYFSARGHGDTKTDSFYHEDQDGSAEVNISETDESKE